MKPKTTLSIWGYAIIRGAVQAQRELRDRVDLTDRELRQRVYLMELGQEIIRGLQAAGIEVPQAVDLSYSLPATAAAARSL